MWKALSRDEKPCVFCLFLFIYIKKRDEKPHALRLPQQFIKKKNKSCTRVMLEPRSTI